MTRDDGGPPEGSVSVFILSALGSLRGSLRTLLEHEGMEIVGESCSASEAARLIPALNPDVTVMDARLPDGRGVDVYRQLKEVDGGVRCIIFTSYPEQIALCPGDGAGLRVVLREIRHDLARTVREMADSKFTGQSG